MERIARRNREIHCLAGGFHTPFSVIYRSSRQKLGKDIVGLNSVINHLDLADIYGTLYAATAEHTFFSSVHETFTQLDHILGHEKKS